MVIPNELDEKLGIELVNQERPLLQICQYPMDSYVVSLAVEPEIIAVECRYCGIFVRFLLKMNVNELMDKWDKVFKNGLFQRLTSTNFTLSILEFFVPNDKDFSLM